MNNQNWAYVTAAYVLTWAVVLGYAIRVHRAVRSARAEFEKVSAMQMEQDRETVR